MFKWLKRSGHATVVAYLALFLALSGGAIAVAGGTKINGSKLKKRSVTGKKLERHTITGTEVNLNKLGQVPSAKAADTATTAGMADVAGRSRDDDGLQVDQDHVERERRQLQSGQRSGPTGAAV